MALELTDANFEELVIKSDKPVIVDFWAVMFCPLVVQVMFKFPAHTNRLIDHQNIYLVKFSSMSSHGRL